MEKSAQFLAGEHATQALIWNEWQRTTQPKAEPVGSEQRERTDLYELFQTSLGQTRGHFYLQIALIRKDRTEIVSVRNSALESPEQPTLTKNSQPGWVDESMLANALAAKPGGSGQVFHSGISPIAGLPRQAPVRLQLQVAVPLFYPETKLGLYGALVLRADFSRLLESRGFNLSPRQLFILTDRQGRFLAHPDPKRVWTDNLAQETVLQ